MRVVTLNGQSHVLIPLRRFRAVHGLPDSFGMALFEAKPAAGLAALDQAGAGLQALWQTVLAALPAALPRARLLDAIDAIQAVFEAELRRINPRVGLEEAEIEFAVAGLVDFGRTWAYAALARRDAPPFDTVYADWLAGSVRVTSTTYAYTARAAIWQVQILNTVYGRIGLVVTTPTHTHYVSDPAYACPAEGFMGGLLREITERLTHALV